MVTKRGIVMLSMTSLMLVGVGHLASVERLVMLAVAMMVGAWFLSTTEAYYDLAGAVTHVGVILAAMSDGPSKRQVLGSVAAVIWATRLGTFLFLRISKDGHDKRFDNIRTNPLGFFVAWLIQALWIIVVELPVIVLNRDPSDPRIRDAIGFAVWVVGFGIEVIADTQKFVFRSQNTDNFMATGLWRYSRHPNFFGEILLWTGLAIVASSGGSSIPWLSPAFTALLLTKATGIPPLEKAARAKYTGNPDFDHYMTYTSRLIPWFPAPVAKASHTD